MQQHMNHVDEATAFIIERFPFAFNTNTKARYWVETKPSYGQRLYTQYQIPNSTMWYKPKQTGYFDIALITTITDPANPNCGLVVPVTVDLKSLSTEHLQMFSTYYTFTPHQKKCVVTHLALHSIYRAPIWKEDIALDYHLNKAAETTPNKEAMVHRRTDEYGITIQSHADALKEQRKAREGISPDDPHPYSVNSPHFRGSNELNPSDNPNNPNNPAYYAGMTPEQIKLMKELNGS